MAAPNDEHNWQRILELAHEVAEVPSEQRESFLRTRCDDPVIVSSVLDLARKFHAPAAAPAMEPGSHIGRFTILARIGQGGMGQVFSAVDDVLNRTVAIKILSGDPAQAGQRAEPMIREARTASSLNHPNIVTIHEVVNTGQTVAIVMEFVPGDSLRVLAANPMNAVACMRAARQIAAALEAAHSAGIIHRDIKPENVVVRPDGQVKVLDFGLARTASGDTLHSVSSAGLWAGTFRYMSPEQCDGSGLTPASDVYSFGTVLYELLAGQHPFPEISPIRTMWSIVNDKPPALRDRTPGLPPALYALIEAMMAKAPAARPAAGAVGAAVESILEDLRGSSSSGGSGVRGPVPGRRLVRAAIWAASLLGLAGLGGVAYWKARPRTPAIELADALTKLLPSNRATAAAISGDGRFLAFANSQGISLRMLESGDTQPLQVPADFVVDHIAWYPDHARMAVSGFSATRNQPAIWQVSITDTPPRLLRQGARGGAPSPDGNELAFVSEDSSEIWVSRADGQQPEKALPGGAGDTFPFVLWSPNGRCVLFQRRSPSTRDLGSGAFDRYFQRSLESFDLRTRRVVSKVPELWIESAAMLPDGRLRFLRYSSPGSYYAKELWEIRTRPESGIIQGQPLHLGGPEREYGGYLAGLTSTGRGDVATMLQATDEHAIYTADFDPSPPRLTHIQRLTLDRGRSFPHAWTPDSLQVIFDSERNTSWDVFRQRVDSAEPEAVVAEARRAEVLPQLAPGGRDVLYATGSGNSSGTIDRMMRVPLTGGLPVEVPLNGSLGEFRCSSGPAGRCVLRRAEEQRSYLFYELDPERGVGREIAKTAWMPGILGDWDVSPDGRWAALPNHDAKSARIRLVALTPGDAEREVVLPGIADLKGLTWAVDGSGWFLSLTTTVGVRTVFAYPSGRVAPLGNLQAVVQAPNGRKVAFVDHIVAANVWKVKFR
ncbi:protein kinase domain-containing protein [Paludibaculum fermentans]|uniref:protein kinase domain-containing protein n=1 Tax=Paludibaculum fermentans TaxID=1473598 RepID=UPI003EB9415A